MSKKPVDIRAVERYKKPNFSALSGTNLHLAMQKRGSMPFVQRPLGFRAVFAWALACALVFAGAVPTEAQTTSASVSGSIRDAQGGVLPGATVTLTSRIPRGR